jgi:hypothetical protein
MAKGNTSYFGLLVHGSHVEKYEVKVVTNRFMPA